MKNCFLVPCVFLILSSSSLSLANDGYSAIGAGGIVFKKSSRVEMLSEILTISETNVNVKYEFMNRLGVSEKKVTEKAFVSFPMPEVACGYWGQKKVPEDFSVLVDGKKVNFLTEVKAYKGDKDVTAQIKKAGLPVDCRDLEKNSKLHAKAKKTKWLDDYQGTDPEQVFYTTRIIYYWQQDFIPNQIVKIEHSYNPVLGADGGHPAWFFNKAPHWDRDPNIFWEKHKEIKDLEFQSSKVKGGNSLNYILTTANTWRGGVAKFTLIIKRKSPDTFIGSTLGPLEVIDDNTFQFRARDFRPDRDLTIFFGKSK
jgi:hypothetical protein